jgi:glycosyltransferase involved in cell wall biosynthesis
VKEPLVTIAICTRNRAALLEKAVRSVMAQLNDNAEILIVNNGSTDGTHVLAEHFAVTCPAIKYFFEPQAGLSIARNSALHTARGEWVVFLDDDAEVEPRWLDAYDQFFQNLPSPKIACVGGPVSPSYEIPPPKWLAANLDNWHGAMKETRRCQPSENPWGCNYAVRRELALIMGGL